MLDMTLRVPPGPEPPQAHYIVADKVMSAAQLALDRAVGTVPPVDMAVGTVLVVEPDMDYL
jgi:hypothetical protein